MARAFGFVERERWLRPDGELSHGELRAGDGVIMLATPTPDYESPNRHRHWSQLMRVPAGDETVYFKATAPALLARPGAYWSRGSIASRAACCWTPLPAPGGWV